MSLLRNLYVTFLIVLLFVISAKAIDDPKLKYILNKFSTYNTNYYNQKIYLHTDKDTYLTRETIWFSAYVFDGVTLEPDNNSGILNLELINIAGYVTHSQLVKIKNGFGFAQLFLNDSIPDGYYLLRAYTNYMKNFPDDMVFNKIVRIYNDSINYRIYHKKIKKAQRKIPDDVQISFHPNNNKLVQGIQNECRILVYNPQDSYNINEGYLYDDKNKLVLNFAINDGSAKFNFTPSGNKYYLKINDLNQKFYLPKTIASAYLIQYENESISLKKTPDIEIKSNLYLIGHNNQRIIFSKIIDKETFDEKIIIPQENLLTGLNKFVLFNGQYEILAEQCIYHEISFEEQIQISYMKKNDSVSILLNLPEVEHNLSMSVTGAENVRNANLNLKTNLYLLSEPLDSEIKNKIFSYNNLNFYTLTNNYIFNFATDNIFWKNIFDDKAPDYKYKFENSISITGTILNERLKYPVSNAIISLSILNQYYDKLSTRSSEKGKFGFYDLNYYDSIDVKLTAVNDDKNNVVIHINEADPYPIKYFPPINNPVLNQFIKPTYTELNKLYEVKDTTTVSKLYREADNVIYIREGNHYKNVFDAIKGKVPGLVVNENDVLIRGRNTFYGSTDPLYLIDGVPTTKEGVEALSMNDVDRIEIIKGSQSSMYGIRGGNGVIAIYTKHGFHVKRGELSFQMLGYMSRKNFTPSHLSLELYKKYKVPKTLFWSPEISQKKEISISHDFSNVIITIEGILNGQSVSYVKSIDIED